MLVINDIKNNIKNILNNRKRKSITDEKSVSAAVLIPLFIKDGEYHLLFTKRSDSVGTHKGQISFPGGVQDETDESFEVTALRESYEELGILSEDIEILGSMDDFVTGTGYIIYPLVGFIPYPYDFEINRDEVDEILEVPISFLLDDKNIFEDKNYIYKGKPYHYISFRYGKHDIWGTTGRMVKTFLNLVAYT
jgi:8-oxo-dGTP pyrophosphatase MutT (NUDIX family)